ncbi:hypothetical protein LCGC14_2339200, partial [marine sediment metagenome]
HLCTGRQVGKTTVFAIKAANYLVNNPNHQVIIVSLTEDQAQLIIVMVLDYLQKNYKTYIKKEKQAPTKNKIYLNNGSSMLARPVGNTGDAVRGFTGDILILDEASRFNEFIFTAATPTLSTTGGKIWMCSTPFGKQGYFYKSWLNKHKRYKIWHQSSEEVLNNRKISYSWTKQQKQESLEYLAEEKKDKSELEYGQEYLGLFIEDLRQFFPDKIVIGAQTGKRPNLINKRADHYIGSDVGRLGDDPSTFEIVIKYDDRAVHVEHQTTKKTLLTQTANHIIGLNINYNFRKIYVDAEGIGIGVFDILISTEATKRKTEALLNSKKIIDYKASKKGSGGRTKMLKEDMYMNLLKVLEQGKIQLLDDPDIFQSFKTIQYEYTTDKRGKPFMHIFGNDSHIVEGLIRAVWCLKQKHLKLFVDYI